MDFYEKAYELENTAIRMYQDLSENCGPYEGIRNILVNMKKNHETHLQTLKEMKDKSCGGMEPTDAFIQTKNLFEKMQSEKNTFSCDMDQLRVYERARDLIIQKLEFYEGMVGKMDCEDDNKMIKELVSEEKKHLVVLENIIEMVNRPNLWLEDAEFNHLDEY
jgi:rubrerythrin